MSQTTVAALATPPGTGAVALIRVSGPEAAAIVSKVFVGRGRKDWKPRTLHLGSIRGVEGDIVDQVLLSHFPAPGSFTGEDVVEITGHGGVLVTKRILEAVFSAGAEPARPGEFSQRAFMNGKIDLTQAEAIMDLISARTELAARAAHEQLAGGLGRAVNQIREGLIKVLAHVEAYVDFPEEDISPDSMQAIDSKMAEIGVRIDQLLSTAEEGRILREGLRTVIFGAPNAGKSSLLNVLLGFDRAIVNPTEGTTRDTIEEVISLKGIPLRLIDTAGIRAGESEVEREGIERSCEALMRADLALWVIDSSESREKTSTISFPEKLRVVPVLNKSDLPRHEDWKEADGIRFSCTDEPEGATLRDHLFEVISNSGTMGESLVAINARHQDCLRKAGGFLEASREVLSAGESPEFVAIDLRSSLEAVGEVVGKTEVEEILGEIFSSFCIGK